jgi:hypothetical protein
LAEVEISRLAVDDLDQLIQTHGLPPNARARVRDSLRPLERFPLLGRELQGAWEGMRFLLGPWPWMLIVYAYAEENDRVIVISIHDGRMSNAASGSR